MFRFILVLIIISGKCFAQTNLDYKKAGLYIQTQFEGDVSKDRLDEIEDSLFTSQPILASNDMYMRAFKSYFFVRSYNLKYIRSAKNVDVAPDENNHLDWLINEAEAFERTELQQLAQIITYERFIKSQMDKSPTVLHKLDSLQEHIESKDLLNKASSLIETFNWRIDDKIPDFDLTRINGETLKLSEITEPFILIDFWFVGCKPCEADFPILQEISKRYKEEVKIISISFFDSKEEIKDWLDQKIQSWPFVYQSSNSKSFNYFQPNSLGFPQYHLISNKLEIIGTGIALDKIESYVDD